MQYRAVPSYSSWQRDSSVAFAVRKNDIVLDRVDRLVQQYWATDNLTKRLIFVCDIFFSLDYWLKTYKTNRRMEKRREPAITALHALTAEELRFAFDCTADGLPRELELMWGRELSASGVHVDIVARPAGYIARAEAAAHRVWFKDGKAYMLQPRLELAESNYKSFVLSMSRELFLDMETASGETIQCSGAMFIEAGVLKRVRLDGNQAPSLMTALRMWGVPLAGVIFEPADYRDNDCSAARVFRVSG